MQTNQSRSGFWMLALAILGATAPDAMGQDLVITSATRLPPALTNEVYSFTFNATGGSPPYSWEAVSGALPLNYLMGTDGQLTGDRTTSPAGDYAFRVRVRDSGTNTAEGDFVLPVAGASIHYTRFGDEAAFAAAGTNWVTLDFEEQAAAGPLRFLGGEYAIAGLRIISTNGDVWVEPPQFFWSSSMLSPGWLPYGGGGGGSSQSDADALTMLFDPPTQAVGWRFVDLGGGPAEGIYIYDKDSNLLFAQDGLPGYGIGSGVNPFWGIVFEDKIIARVEILETANDGDDVAYDNIRFEGSLNLGVYEPELREDAFRMRVTGPSGATVVIEESADFQSWAAIRTNTLPPPGVLSVSVLRGTNHARFFRARED